MNKKIIVFGSFLSIFLMLMIPSINASFVPISITKESKEIQMKTTIRFYPIAMIDINTTGCIYSGLPNIHSYQAIGSPIRFFLTTEISSGVILVNFKECNSLKAMIFIGSSGTDPVNWHSTAKGIGFFVTVT